MALTTSLRKSYLWRMIIIAVISLVLGLWGVWDYAVGIPAKQESFDKFTVISRLQAAIETDQLAGQLSQESRAAIEIANAEMEAVFLEHRQQIEKASGETFSEDQIADLQSSIKSSQDSNWLGLLLVNFQGLRSARMRGDLGSSPPAEAAYEANKSFLNQFDDPPKKPAAFDRIVQWGFILCLPVVPWVLWRLRKEAKNRYSIDDDGALHLPAGTWAADDIASIDMGRWMSKSVATVKNRDGSEAKLDDYLHRDMHLIVGSIAHRFHPEEWLEDAKPVKADADEGDAQETSEDDPTPEDDGSERG